MFEHFQNANLSTIKLPIFEIQTTIFYYGSIKHETHVLNEMSQSDTSMVDMSTFSENPSAASPMMIYTSRLSACFVQVNINNSSMAFLISVYVICLRSVVFL